MSRVVVKKKVIRDFLDKVKEKSSISWDGLGKRVSLSGRTLRDWRRGVLLPKKEILEKLAKAYKVRMPRILEEREEFWSAKKYARKGALARLKKHGLPGTPEGRRKGGLVSQEKRRQRPEYYRKIGVIIRNEIKTPRNSKALAEFIGIVLGDGGLTKWQCFISLNISKDKYYALYVAKLIRALFKIKASLYHRPEYGTTTVAVSGRDFIDFLVNKGLKTGDKVKNQIDVPKWIKNNLVYSKRCLKGLMDTDGGVFEHRYIIGGKKYQYKKICFTNRSRPLLNFVYKTLKKVGLNPKLFGSNKVWVYKKSNVKKYFKIIGSSNQRLLSGI